MDNGVEDYILLMEGNKGLLAERIDFRHCCEDLKVALAVVPFDSTKIIADLEVRAKFVEAHSVNVDGASKKHLRDFEDGLV
jgi:hypothetical protein